MLAFVASELGDGWEEGDGSAGAEASGSIQTQTIPQRHRRPIPVLGLITLSDIDRLERIHKEDRGWVAVTTDAIFLDKLSYYDLLIDLTTASPNARPTLWVTRRVDVGTAGAKEWRKSIIRFVWSDLKLVRLYGMHHMELSF